MSTNLKNNWKLLQSISRNKHCGSRRTQLRNAVKDITFHKCMREICHNVMKRKVPLSLKDVRKLQKHKPAIKALAKKSTTKKKREQHIVQSGAGFLPILIPLISSILAGVLQK